MYVSDKYDMICLFLLLFLYISLLTGSAPFATFYFCPYIESWDRDAKVNRLSLGQWHLSMSLSNSIRSPITTRNLLRPVRSLPLNIVRAFVLPLCVFTRFGSQFARRPLLCPDSCPICTDCPLMLIIVGLLPDHESDPLAAYSRAIW
jgi:hypothetical protein